VLLGRGCDAAYPAGVDLVAWIRGSGLMVQGLGFRVKGPGFRVCGLSLGFGD